MKKVRWAWQKVDGNFFAEFNSADFLLGRKFCVVDTNTGCLYYLEGLSKTKNGVFDQVIIPKWLCNIDFINWSISSAYQIVEYLPTGFLTPDVVDNLLLVVDKIKEDFIKDYIFKSIPEEVFGDAILKYPEIFLKIPDKYKTALLVEKYASTKDSDYKFIPRKYKIVAVKANGKFLKYVSESKMNEELVDKAFESNPVGSIAYIPKKYQTIERQMKVIEIDVTNICKIPNKYLFDEVIDYALSKNISVFDELHDDRKTFERCRKVLLIDGKKLSKIPRKCRVYDLCLVAVITTPSAVRLVPEEILTKKFYDEVVSRGVVIPDSCMKYFKGIALSSKSLEELFSMYKELKKQLEELETIIDEKTKTSEVDVKKRSD